MLDFDQLQSLELCLAPFAHVTISGNGVGHNDKFLSAGTGVVEKSGDFFENAPEAVTTGFGTLLDVRLQIGHCTLMSSN